MYDHGLVNLVPRKHGNLVKKTQSRQMVSGCGLAEMAGRQRHCVYVQCLRACACQMGVELEGLFRTHRPGHCPGYLVEYQFVLLQVR